MADALISPQEIAAHFERMRRDRRPNLASVPTVALDVDPGDGPARLSVSSSGEGQLLLPIPVSHVFHRELDTRNVAVSDTTLVVDEFERRFLVVKCSDKALESVFCEFVQEILSRLSQGQEPGTAINESVSAFRALLRGQIRLADEKLCGLIGELVVLKVLVEAKSDSVDLWTGPLHAAHDFIAPGGAIEVKSTRSASGYRATIHGFGQLDPDAAGMPLYLVFVRLARMPNGDLTLSSLTNDIVMAANSRQPFWDAVEAAGVPREEIPAYDDASFVLTEFRCIDVVRGVPRLTRIDFADETIPAGVLDVEYDIDLSASISTSREGSQALAFLKSLVEPAKA